MTVTFRQAGPDHDIYKDKKITAVSIKHSEKKQKKSEKDLRPSHEVLEEEYQKYLAEE